MSTMSEARILLLDVMGTLINEPFFEHLPRHFGLSLEDLIRDKHPTSWIDFEKGLIDEAAYVARFFRDGRAVDLEAVRGCLLASYEWLDGVEALLEELKQKGVPMHAFSNYSSWYRLIDQKLDLSRYLEWSFVSCNTGIRKPDPEAYRCATRVLGVRPDQCVFVDDQKRNVAAAEAAGMKGILRGTDILSLRSDLARVGVI